MEHWLEYVNELHFYLSPEQRNVVFPSAMDGWNFGMDVIDKIESKD